MMDDREIPDIPVNISNELERIVADAFSLFDYNQNKTIDPKEVGTVMRALGCCPNEEDIDELIEDCEDRSMPGIVHLIKFLPNMCRRLTEHRFKPAEPEELLKAFHTIDIEGKGFITKEYMIELMTTYGEKFSEDEIDEMLEVAVDPLTQTVPYEYYLNKIMFESKVNLYDLADKIEASKPKPTEKKKRQISISFDDMEF